MLPSSHDFNFQIEQFADIRILRYQVPEFESLTPGQKKLIYYLSQAALEGRDIIFDQNNRFNLIIRRILEAIYSSEVPDKSTSDFKALEIYLKRVWFSNGIHHHYSMDKFVPEFSESYFVKMVKDVDPESLPLEYGQSVDELLKIIVPVIFDEKLYAKRVNQAVGEDLIASSANNYYKEGITQKEVEAFYKNYRGTEGERPISAGLNSQLAKTGERLAEKVWKEKGMYGSAIERILNWLMLAASVCENNSQKRALDLLIRFYQTGDLEIFDAYSIAWLNDENSRVDFVNGFIETYGDALGLKASWESLVNFKDVGASERTEIISQNAQWFEDHSPVNPAYRKKKVKGVSAKVITVAMLGGDCYPATPIGVNLPNSDWIRKAYGSKSVTIENITYAYHKSSENNGFLEAFAFEQAEIDRHKMYGFLTDNLHTDLHECLGHGSGQLAEGIKGDELKAYGATIEEARADLFGLYYMADKKLVELNLLPDEHAFKTAYDTYIRNGLMTQLTRIKLYDDVIESHMRNRQLIAQWCFVQGNGEVVQKVIKENKTYFVIKDYQKLRSLFGQLLKEIQRVKSEGDYDAAKQLVEDYAVKVDVKLHKEVLERFEKLKIAPYAGFVNPICKPLIKAGEIVDVRMDYTESFSEQMLRYSREHSWLPNIN